MINIYQNWSKCKRSWLDSCYCTHLGHISHHIPHVFWINRHAFPSPSLGSRRTADVLLAHRDPDCDVPRHADQRWQNMPVPPDQKAPKIKSLNVMNMIIVINHNKSNVMRELLSQYDPSKLNWDFPLFCPSFRSFRLDSASLLVLRFSQLRLVRLEKLIVKGKAQERRHPAEPTIHFTIVIISIVMIHPTMHVDR